MPRINTKISYQSRVQLVTHLRIERLVKTCTDLIQHRTFHPYSAAIERRTAMNVRVMIVLGGTLKREGGNSDAVRQAKSVVALNHRETRSPSVALKDGETRSNPLSK